MTASTEIAKINKWIYGNGQKGAEKTITEQGKDIETLKDEIKCKADAVQVEGLAKQISDMSDDVKKLLERSGGSMSAWQFISTLIAIAAVVVAIFK